MIAEVTVKEATISADPTCCIFVAPRDASDTIGFSSEEMDIRDIFATLGTIVLMKSQYLPQRKQFGFTIQYTSPKIASVAAVEMNGFDLRKRVHDVFLLQDALPQKTSSLKEHAISLVGGTEAAAGDPLNNDGKEEEKEAERPDDDAEEIKDSCILPYNHLVPEDVRLAPVLVSLLSSARAKGENEAEDATFMTKMLAAAQKSLIQTERRLEANRKRLKRAREAIPIAIPSTNLSLISVEPALDHPINRTALVTEIPYNMVGNTQQYSSQVSAMIFAMTTFGEISKAKFCILQKTRPALLVEYRHRKSLLLALTPRNPPTAPGQPGNPLVHPLPHISIDGLSYCPLLPLAAIEEPTRNVVPASERKLKEKYGDLTCQIISERLKRFGVFINC